MFESERRALVPKFAQQDSAVLVLIFDFPKAFLIAHVVEYGLQAGHLHNHGRTWAVTQGHHINALLSLLLTTQYRNI